MMKKILVAVSILLCVVTLSFNMSAVNSKVTAVEKNENVITVSKNDNVKSGVLNARFLNMLNHNFVYDSDFYDEETLVNNSVLALLDLAKDGYIAQNYVSDYIFNMYGKKITDFSQINKEFEQKQGYVFVLPRGYSICTHQIASVTDNQDGSFTVITNIKISLDDGSVINDTATTLFLRNTESQFGFNIIYSEIGSQIVNTLDC